MNWFTKLFYLAFPQKDITPDPAKKSFDEVYKELGAFEYNEHGFMFVYQNFEEEIAWDDITQLNVYKTDLMTTDRIDMEIVYGGKSFIINEEIPGWYQFIIKTKEIFPSIPKEWDVDIIWPAFATNYKTIYKKDMSLK